MDNHVLRNKAFSLVETSLGLGIISLLLLALSPVGAGIIAQSKDKRMQNNLKAIGQACQQYYMGFGQWPVQVSDLQPFFLNSTVDVTSYTLSPQANILTIYWESSFVTVVKPYSTAARVGF